MNVPKYGDHRSVTYLLRRTLAECYHGSHQDSGVVARQCTSDLSDGERDLHPGPVRSATRPEPTLIEVRYISSALCRSTVYLAV